VRNDIIIVCPTISTCAACRVPPKDPNDKSIHESVLISRDNNKPHSRSVVSSLSFYVAVAAAAAVIVVIAVDNRDILIGSDSVSVFSTLL
jgi:hypothetical protein